MSLIRIEDDFTGYFDGIEKEKITMPDGTIEIKYDRAKNARFQADMMLSLNTSGISEGITDCFKIVPGSGLSVIRSPGEGWLDGHFANLKYQQSITLPENNQIYYYIIRCMSDAENRCMYEGVLMNPDVSTLPVRTVNTFDLVVAKIEVPAGATQITESMITDLRLNKDLCGYMVSNSNPAKIIVTADDVTDTDTHLIPVKTKLREQSLRGDGSYSEDLTNNTIGNYKFVYDSTTDTMQIIHKNNSQVNFSKTPMSYQVMSSDGTTDLDNMLSVDDLSYGEIKTNTSIPAIVIFKYFDALPVFELSSNIDIKIKIKTSKANTYIISSFYCVLYDLDTGSVISSTQSDLTSTTTAKTTEFNFHFAAWSDIPVFNIGVYVYAISGSNTNSIQIYGSELTITYDAPYKTLLKIDPNKVTAYNYENGSAAVIGITPLSEVQSEPEIMTFTEPDEDIPPHGTSPETALPYVKSVYMKGEYMIHDDKIYKCLEDNTIHPPSIAAVAHKWELVV